jgi:hypothetical protein
MPGGNFLRAFGAFIKRQKPGDPQETLSIKYRKITGETT